MSTASPFHSSTEATSCNASFPSPVSLVQASHSSHGCTIPQTSINLRPARSNATPIFSPASVQATSSCYGPITTPLLSSTLVRADATENKQFSIVLLLQLVNNHNNYYTFYNATITSNTKIINVLVFCFKCSHWQYYK